MSKMDAVQEANVMAKLKNDEGDECFQTFVPFGVLITIVPHIKASMERSQLVMPDGKQNPLRTLTATVVAVGPKCEQVKKGDVVLLQENAVQRVYPIHHGNSGQVYTIREDQVLGIEPRKEG